MPTLTVVIPVFNQAAHIGATLAALDRALAASSFDSDVVVVDDGSTDGTAEAVEAAGSAIVRRQQNGGRFAARQAGLEIAGGEYCLLLDSRVRLEPHGLKFVEEHLEPGREIWNGHVDIDREDGPYAVFWDVLTRRAFRTYFGEPRTTSFGLADFERFPKGTTCLFAPRAMLVEAFGRFRSRYDDLHDANDDVPVLRDLAAAQSINISPGFRCTYSSRTELRPFLRHAFHRGAVFVDGHGRPESAWFPIVLGLYAASAGCALVARRAPSVAVAAVALAGAGGAALSLAERRPRDAVTMAWVTPLYAAAHVAGMWRGLGLLVRARL